MNVLDAAVSATSKIAPKRKVVTQSGTYAVKLQSKYQLIKGKQQEHLLNEIKLMNSLDHPFILDLKCVG